MKYTRHTILLQQDNLAQQKAEQQHFVVMKTEYSTASSAAAFENATVNSQRKVPTAPTSIKEDDEAPTTEPTEAIKSPPMTRPIINDTTTSSSATRPQKRQKINDNYDDLNIKIISNNYDGMVNHNWRYLASSCSAGADADADADADANVEKKLMPEDKHEATTITSDLDITDHAAGGKRIYDDDDDDDETSNNGLHDNGNDKNEMHVENHIDAEGTKKKNDRNNDCCDDVALAVAPLVSSFVDDGIGTYASFDSSDDEAIIEHMKSVATKKNKKKSKPRSEIAATATATATANNQSVGDESSESSSDSGSSSNNNDNNKNVTIRSIYTDTLDVRGRWMEMYQRLVAYKKEHKDTNVPRRYEKDTQLGNWADNQRRIYREKSMTEERKSLLTSIGLVWPVRPQWTSTATWEEMYERLVAYKKEHNNTRVPSKYEKDPQLGNWTSKQRATYKNKKMTEGKKDILNSIDFKWYTRALGTSTATWEEMFQRLVAYKQEHNDTNVSRHYKENRKLGNWVHNQRLACRTNKITEERKRLLYSIGVVQDTG